jgi:hypothetical protein
MPGSQALYKYARSLSIRPRLGHRLEHLLAHDHARAVCAEARETVDSVTDLVRGDRLARLDDISRKLKARHGLAGILFEVLVEGLVEAKHHKDVGIIEADRTDGH